MKIIVNLVVPILTNVKTAPPSAMSTTEAVAPIWTVIMNARVRMDIESRSRILKLRDTKLRVLNLMTIQHLLPSPVMPVLKLTNVKKDQIIAVPTRNVSTWPDHSDATAWTASDIWVLQAATRLNWFAPTTMNAAMLSTS